MCQRALPLNLGLALPGKGGFFTQNEILQRELTVGQAHRLRWIQGTVSEAERIAIHFQRSQIRHPNRLGLFNALCSFLRFFLHFLFALLRFFRVHRQEQGGEIQPVGSQDRIHSRLAETHLRQGDFLLLAIHGNARHGQRRHADTGRVFTGFLNLQFTQGQLTIAHHHPCARFRGEQVVRLQIQFTGWHGKTHFALGQFCQ